MFARMHGQPDIIAKLNELLTAELTAADLYLLFSRRFQRQGYTRLHERLAHEATDELRHAEKLTERILLLEGTPDVLSRLSVEPPSEPKEVLQLSLQFEHDVVSNLNEVIALCEEHGDAGTRAILEELLQETENDHVFWLESQLALIAQVGLNAYLGEQL